MKFLDPLNITVFDEPYYNMLSEHFARLTYELEMKRGRSKDIFSWQAEVRNKLKKALGDFMHERTDLNAKVIDKIERRDYVIEKIVFESLPKLYVTGNLYIPKNGDFPVPAVLRVHGHWYYAKKSGHVQASCIGLAKRGYVVLAIDTFGYGERSPQGSHINGVWLYSVGLTLQGLILWDNIRALDYLTTRKEVDPKRIGVTGASGGGNQTMYLAAIDERVKVAVPVVSAEIFEDQVVSGRCICECIPGMLRFANVPDILALIAPRPLLLINGIKDRGFTILRARKAYLRLKEIYKTLGFEDRVALVEVYSGHGYYKEMREAMYSWFDKWLKGIKTPEKTEEDIVEVESEISDNLNCFREFPRDTVTLKDIYYNKVIELRKNRQLSDPNAWVNLRDELRKDIIADVFGGFPEKCPLNAKTVNAIDTNEYHIELISFRSELDIIIPAVLIRRKEAKYTKYPVVIYLTPLGKRVVLARREVRELVDRGYAVLSIDYRGIGETEYDELIAVKNSIVIGRHILGMRVYDVIRTLDYIGTRKDLDKHAISCWGEGEASIIALIAAALDDRVKDVRVYKLPATLESKEGFNLPPSIFAPNMLKYADIPELAAMIAPRHLTVVKPMDPLLRPLNYENALKLFEFTIKVYKTMNAESNFTIHED